MNPAHQRLASAFAALVWAGVLLHFCISGRINLYLAPGFRNYALAGGLGLALVGLFVLLTHKTRASCGHDHAPGEEHNHEASDMPAWGIIASMVLPLLATAWLTNDSFSMRALAHKGAFDQPVKLTPAPGGVPTREQLEARPRTDKGAVTVDLLEVYFASMDPEYAKAMEGMMVEVQARVAMHEKGWIAYRLLLSCCAADGRPLSVTLEIPAELDVLPDKVWARVTGRLSYREGSKGSLTPVIAVSHLMEEDAPAEEYLLRY